MSAVSTLSSGRLCLRQWREEDRDAFAAMNADARVMEFFRGCLTRAESDAMVDHIERHFSDHGFGLWAIEVPGVSAFVGFAGLEIPAFNAHFTPCVEIGWRLAFEHWGRGYATEAARLALDHGFATLALSEIVSFTSTTNRRSRAVMNVSGCITIQLTISTIPGCRRVIRSAAMSCTGSTLSDISQGAELAQAQSRGLRT